jgi:hypothetical protein
MILCQYIARVMVYFVFVAVLKTSYISVWARLVHADASVLYDGCGVSVVVLKIRKHKFNLLKPSGNFMYRQV